MPIILPWDEFLEVEVLDKQICFLVFDMWIIFTGFPAGKHKCVQYSVIAQMKSEFYSPNYSSCNCWARGVEGAMANSVVP